MIDIVTVGRSLDRHRFFNPGSIHILVLVMTLVGNRISPHIE